MFTVVVEKAGDIAVIRCTGRLVRGEAVSVLRNALTSQRDTRIFVLDLCEVEALDAGGISALLTVNQWASDRGCQLKLVNLSGFVLEVLQRTKLDHVFDISTLHDALAVLAGTTPHELRYAACS